MKKKVISKFKKITINLIGIFIVIQTIYNLFLKIQLVNTNEEFLKKLLNNRNYYELYVKDYNSILNKGIRFLTNIEITNPTTILENKFKFKEEIKPVMYTTSSDDIYIKDKTSEYIEDPIKKEVTNPKVYIYNTHQLESYNKKVYKDYNITPNVMMASYILRENLNNKNINTIVETANITDFLNANG